MWDPIVFMELLNSICAGLGSAALCRSSSGGSCTVLAAGSSSLHCLVLRALGICALRWALGTTSPEAEGTGCARGTTVSLGDFR